MSNDEENPATNERKPNEEEAPQGNQQPPHSLHKVPFPPNAPLNFPGMMLGGTGGPAQVLVNMRAQQSWEAPLPQPKDAAEYERILPGSFDRILAIHEQNSAAQRDVIKKDAETRQMAVSGEQKAGTSGRRYAFAGLCLDLLLATGVGCLGHDKLAYTLVGAPLVTAFAAFLVKTNLSRLGQFFSKPSNEVRDDPKSNETQNDPKPRKTEDQNKE